MPFNQHGSSKILGPYLLPYVECPLTTAFVMVVLLFSLTFANLSTYMSDLNRSSLVCNALCKNSELGEKPVVVCITGMLICYCVVQ